MIKNVILYIIISLLGFLGLQGCHENTLPPDTDNLLPCPRQIFPQNKAVDVSIPIIFIWNVCEGANSYGLQISSDSNYSIFSYNESEITDTFRMVNNLNHSTKYYWRVNAVYPNGPSLWSIITQSFTTINACSSIITVDYYEKTYNTIDIGNQCWFKENLNAGTAISSDLYQPSNGEIEKYCYGDIPANCNIYGGLYQWFEAMQYRGPGITRGICPQGWHVPSRSEFDTLSAFVGGDGNSLKEVGQGLGGGWGTNTSGFSALLAGGFWEGSFSRLGNVGSFWSSTIDYYAYVWTVYDANRNIGGGWVATNSAMSVRCIRN